MLLAVHIMLAAVSPCLACMLPSVRTPTSAKLQPLQDGMSSKCQPCDSIETSSHFVTRMQAGTFEERNVTAWAKERLAELLVGLSHTNAGANVLVTELTSAAGEAHIWIMRSKKRCGLVAWRCQSSLPYHSA